MFPHSTTGIEYSFAVLRLKEVSVFLCVLYCTVLYSHSALTDSLVRTVLVCNVYRERPHRANSALATVIHRFAPYIFSNEKDRIEFSGV